MRFQVLALTSLLGFTFANAYSGDITVYNSGSGAIGACGTPITDSGMTVALAQDMWGTAGAATNPWCGQKVQITYGSNAPVIATIVDMCSGCSGADLDLTPAVWNEVTDSASPDNRFSATWDLL